MMDKIKLVVFEGFILGYILPELPNYVQVIHESVLKGGCRASTQFRSNVLINSKSNVRLASKEDFDDFRVMFDGYEKDKNYEYQKISRK